MYAVDRNQGTTKDGSTFGYVFVGEGGVFFTWRYDTAAPIREQIRQVVATAEEDSVDPPTGRWSWAGVERAIRSHIRRYGMFPNTGKRCETCRL